MEFSIGQVEIRFADGELIVSAKIEGREYGLGFKQMKPGWVGVDFFLNKQHRVAVSIKLGADDAPKT